MEHAGGFNEHEQLLRVRHLGLEPGEELAQATGTYRQIFFEEETLVRPAERGANFVFGGIKAEDVGLFH